MIDTTKLNKEIADNHPHYKYEVKKFLNFCEKESEIDINVIQKYLKKLLKSSNATYRKNFFVVKKLFENSSQYVVLSNQIIDLYHNHPKFKIGNYQKEESKLKDRIVSPSEIEDIIQNYFEIEKEEMKAVRYNKLPAVAILAYLYYSGLKISNAINVPIKDVTVKKISDGSCIVTYKHLHYSFYLPDFKYWSAIVNYVNRKDQGFTFVLNTNRKSVWRILDKFFDRYDLEKVRPNDIIYVHLVKLWNETQSPFDIRNRIIDLGYKDVEGIELRLKRLNILTGYKDE